MSSLIRHYHGILVLAEPKEVLLFWHSNHPETPGIFSVKSTDGKNFQKTFHFVSYHKSTGAKTSFGPTTIVRANARGVPADLCLSEKGKPGLLVAIQKNQSWKIIAQSSLLSGPTVIAHIPGSRKEQPIYAAFSSRQGRSVFLALSRADLSHFRESATVLRARPNHFDHSHLSPLYTEVLDEQFLIVYTAQNKHGQATLGAALIARDEPTKLIWRSDFPLWQENAGAHSSIRFLGGFPRGRYFSLYIESPEKGIEYFPVAMYWQAPRLTPQVPIALPKRQRGIKIQLERAAHNPLLEPRARYAWESFASFNPAAIVLNNEIHLLYRAQGYDGQSVLGHAVSQNGLTINERSTKPIFVPTKISPDNSPLYSYHSGGGTGGCEDPRIVEINDTLYLIYVAFDGSKPPGVALTSISKTNFLKKRWRWSQPRLISRPGQIQKNWVLFPEKIKGKFAILHGISPEIKIEYLTSLDQLGKNRYIESLASHGGRGYITIDRLAAWDNIVRGVGPPPIKTTVGWLVLYHGMDMRDPGKYKVGAMLLDLEHPEKILHRALEPVLEPEADYENHGHKSGVVYVCGAVIKGDTLFVYYGASDRTSAVATANINTFLQDLCREKPPILQKMHIRKRS